MTRVAAADDDVDGVVLATSRRDADDSHSPRAVPVNSLELQRRRPSTVDDYTTTSVYWRDVRGLWNHVHRAVLPVPAVERR